MKGLLTFCLSACCFSGGVWADYLTHDQLGATTVRHLQERYNSVVADCGTPKRPSVLCSGILIRGTVYSADYNFWDYGPASKEATAFSWLRKDAKFRQLASDHQHGYILLPNFYATKSQLDVSVLCAFVTDAGSHVRSDAGCGDAVTTEFIERSCQAYNIRTAEAWQADYLTNKSSHHRQCGFDLRPANESQGASIFMAFVKAHQFVTSEHFSAVGLSNNEVRLGSWPHSDGSAVPVEALFFLQMDTVTGAPTEAGKAPAQKDQMAYYRSAGHFIPIIRMTLPLAPGNDATFEYRPADQARLEDVTCTRFIDQSVWIRRYDPGAKADKWTLSITPTDCGRLSQANQLDKFFAQIIAKHGRDPEWAAENNGGVRRQLACLLETYRGNTTYNIEPFRPDTTQALAVAAKCNNL